MSSGNMQMNAGAVLMQDGRVRFENCACCSNGSAPDSPYIPWDSTYSIPSCSRDLSSVFTGYPLSTYYPPRFHRMCLRGLIYCPLVRTAGAYVTIPTPQVYRLAQCQAGTGWDTWQKPHTNPACVAVAAPTGKPFNYECNCTGLFDAAPVRPESALSTGAVDALPTAADLNYLFGVLSPCSSITDGAEHVLQLIVCYVRWTIRDRATKTIVDGDLSHVAIVSWQWIRNRCATVGCS